MYEARQVDWAEHETKITVGLTGGWLNSRSAGQAEIVEIDGDDAVAVVGDMHGLVAGERRAIRSLDPEAQRECVVRIAFIDVEVSPCRRAAFVGRARGTDGGDRAGLGKGRPHLVAIREVGDVLDG